MKKMFRTIRQKVKVPIKALKATKYSQAIKNAMAQYGDIKNIPGDELLRQSINQVKLAQIEYTERGDPITEDQIRSEFEREWKAAGKFYEMAGVKKQDMLDGWLIAIVDTDGAEPLPKPVQWLVNKVSRNTKCPCGSGKKYKKCCLGKDK